MPELVCPACHGCAEVHVQTYDLALRRVVPGARRHPYFPLSPGFDPLFQGIVPIQPPGGRMVA